MGDFANKLRALVSLELTAVRRADPAATAAMIEALANSLGLVIAVAAKGEAVDAQELLTGAESYLYQTVTDHSPLARALAAPIQKET